jgi:hypothetical protein
MFIPSLERFRPRHPFRQPAPSCRCSRGPLRPCFSFAPACHPERSEGSALLRVALHEMRITDVSPSRFSDIPTFKYFNAPLPQVTSHQSLSPSESALTQNAPITPLESALPKKGGGGRGYIFQAKEFRFSSFHFRFLLFRCHYSLLHHQHFFCAPPRRW